MDHIQGLGFFTPLRNPDVEVHIWGPASTTLNLKTRLMRYLSPPLFPVRLRELPCILILHEVPCGDFEIGEFRISSELVCHPGPTVGYRIATSRAVFAYIPDHEPALGTQKFPLDSDWTSGYSIAARANLLIHDAQYTNEEYLERIGWGHSSIQQAIEFAKLAKVKHLILFHHDPAHDDKVLDLLITKAIASTAPSFPVTAATEGAIFEL
jgi:ribonuclease BN (tRNA processing enzyme)